MSSKGMNTKKKGSKKTRKGIEEPRQIEDKFLAILDGLVKETYPSQKELHRYKRQHRALSKKLSDTNDLNLTYNLLKNHLFKGNTLALYPDIIIINQVIKKLASSNKLSLAMLFYDLAVDNGFASTVTFNTLIDMAGKQGHLEIARQVFEKAKTLGKTNDTCYHIFINALVRNKHFNEAKEVYSNSRLAIGRKGQRYDLHGFSFGSSQVAVDLLLSQTKKPTNFTFITGKGIHSSNRKEHQIQSAITSYLSSKNISYKVNPHNGGQLMVNYEPSQKHQPSRVEIQNNRAGFFTQPSRLTPSNTTLTWTEIAAVL